MQFHDLALAVVAFFSEVLGAISGFGSSTFFVPAATFFESFRFVLALTALLHCFGNVFKIFLFRRSFDWKLILQFAIPSVILCGFGALLTSVISLHGLERMLGVFLIAYSLWGFAFKNRNPIKWPKYIGVILTMVSGFLTGFIGTGGALRGVALSTLNISKDSFVFLSSAIDVGGDFTRAGIYIANGYMDWAQWYYIPLLMIAAYSGARVGKEVLRRIPQTHFEKIVLIFILFSGIALVAKA